MITNEIGLNAGKIWTFLNEKGDHSVKDLIKKIKLSTADFYMAVGWLAREGKVNQYEQEGIMMIGLR
ncbi:MAG: winged helix-turn-helix domain-containing protein [Mariniphaga sp.]|nr:winged helix-turn-helix domain-containing protein [Mariniphaga sp.]MDD4424914.1 winged helix-turn-helix domain-containing protein [Mariniphaga sp.]